MILLEVSHESDVEVPVETIDEVRRDIDVLFRPGDVVLQRIEAHIDREERETLRRIAMKSSVATKIGGHDE